MVRLQNARENIPEIFEGLSQNVLNLELYISLLKADDLSEEDLKEVSRQIDLQLQAYKQNLRLLRQEVKKVESGFDGLSKMHRAGYTKSSSDYEQVKTNLTEFTKGIGELEKDLNRYTNASRTNKRKAYQRIHPLGKPMLNASSQAAKANAEEPNKSEKPKKFTPDISDEKPKKSTPDISDEEMASCLGKKPSNR